jgi:hypothetical protein
LLLNSTSLLPNERLGGSAGIEQCRMCDYAQAAATGQPRITTEQAKAQVAALKVCAANHHA